MRHLGIGGSGEKLEDVSLLAAFSGPVRRGGDSLVARRAEKLAEVNKQLLD